MLSVVSTTVICLVALPLQTQAARSLFNGTFVPTDMAVADGLTRKAVGDVIGFTQKHSVDMKVSFVGLNPNTFYPVYLYDGPCSDDRAPRFKADPKGEQMPPNELWIKLHTDAQGRAIGVAHASFGVPDVSSCSVAVHSYRDWDEQPRLFCADLELRQSYWKDT